MNISRSDVDWLSLLLQYKRTLTVHKNGKLFAKKMPTASITNVFF